MIALERLDPESLALGEYVVVRYGTRAEQLARFYGRRSWGSRFRVEKWRANSRRWTRPVGVAQRDFLRRATAADLKKFKPASGAPMGAR